MSLEFLGQGSAKDLYLHSHHKEHVVLMFSDRVSVFDYGAIGEGIAGRGRALERFAYELMHLFEKERIPTLFDAKLSRELGAFVMRRAQHPKFKSGQDFEWEFIPLEIIFRLGAPQGSSLLVREPNIKVGTLFEAPRIEFSTKLESSDRLLDFEEAQKLAGSPEIFSGLQKIATQSALLMREYFKRFSLTLWDGKIECARNKQSGAIALVDAITPDELRLTFEDRDDVPLSKELLRSWLSATEWGARLKIAKAQDPTHFRSKVPPPPKLGVWREHKLKTLFESLAEVLATKNPSPLEQWFHDKSVLPQVFVLGSGGREAALRWRLAFEGAELAESDAKADAVLVSMDADLAAGKVDEYLAKSQWVFGPSQSASKLEWSKSFGREVALKAKIPSPHSSTRPEDLKNFSEPPVVKCDGLAAGKGVVVPKSFDEAAQALETFRAKGPVVLEEQLRGFEASVFFAIQSSYQGISLTYLGSAQDFKRRFAANQGPNTGGMGAYVPHPELGAADILTFRKWAFELAQQMQGLGAPYNGILYLGLLKDSKKGWNLLEFNARFGDPETQALVMAWDQSQKILLQLLQLDLRRPPAEVKIEGAVTCLALVRNEYPDPPTQTDFKLSEWDFKSSNEGAVQLFRSESLKGRVAYLVGRGKDLFSSGDAVFSVLVESPWRHQLDWRADILP